ncbi:YebC/PmpR family DNA-binding transcriptional regulator [Bacillus marinisedimentorum]|uniref:YebC/PmpR family DNA-binding transcriptional regulator n=1 Tax=Bacillus marinisedimentorum TaxID=1821260 RepID=UPI0008733332|nr:YebC/PmpR family DNA-binding transcriptional regulator [Bacillus marinisedimentorum]
MAGHSKWKNIQRRKNAQDAKRGKIFMKLAKEIFVAAKNGDGDPETNPALRLAVDKAKANNMPNDNIERAIKKATGGLDGVNYEEFTYEGYGPGGAAVMVNVLTDNKNRTAAAVRHAFSKNGGNLGENGCVSYMFDPKGYLVIERDGLTIGEDDMMLQVIDAGAEEIETTDETFEVYTDFESFDRVKTVLKEKGFEFSTAETTMVPQTYTHVAGGDEEKLLKLIDMLEEEEDVQDIYHNFDMNDETHL